MTSDNTPSLPNPQSYQFSEEIQLHLRSYGWFPGRVVSDEVIRKNCLPVIQKTGYRIFPAAIRILKEYGGLDIIPYSERYLTDRLPNPLIIWPFENLLSSPSSLFAFEWRLNQVLFPIARFLDNDIYFFVNPQGEIYGFVMISGHIYFYGNCFEAALDNIIGQRNGQARKLDVPHWKETREEAEKYFSWMKA